MTPNAGSLSLSILSSNPAASDPRQWSNSFSKNAESRLGFAFSVSVVVVVNFFFEFEFEFHVW